MPMIKEKYPDNWKEIAFTVKEMAGWKCDMCGRECYRPGDDVVNTQHVLTVSHINHVEADCRLENLAAACAPCHLKYDNLHRMWRNRVAKRIKNDALNTLFPAESLHRAKRTAAASEWEGDIRANFLTLKNAASILLRYIEFLEDPEQR